MSKLEQEVSSLEKQLDTEKKGTLSLGQQTSQNEKDLRQQLSQKEQELRS